MPNLLKAIITVAILCICIPTAVIARNEISSKDVSNILERLDTELGKRQDYIDRRLEAIDSLKGLIADRSLSVENTLDGLMKLGDCYNALNTDSALLFYSKGEALAHAHAIDSTALRFNLRIATFLPLLSFINEAETRFDSINPSDLKPSLEAEYLDAARQMNFYIASNLTGYPEMYDTYMDKSRDAQSKLLAHLNPESPKFMLNQGEYFFYHNQYDKASTVLLLLLEKVPIEDNLYARACHFLADISKAKGDHNAYIYYLALSAIADTRGATLEVTSLQELGRLMYLDGDVSRAYDYLSTALSEAVECNAPLRILQSSNIFPIIQNAYNAEIRRSDRRLYIIIVIMGFLLAGVALTLYILQRKNRQMNKMAKNLEEANSIKDVYISQFLNLCSIYMDKLNQFNKMVNRKLSTGKVDDLLKITKQGKYIEEQSKEFYDVFDDAFLHLYPNFVSEVNKLLRSEEQILLKDGEKLNTDLRIIAFMRLGIEESTRIAQMLNYSVYTIYTYRNKFKNRAIDRDSFESDIMKIK